MKIKADADAIGGIVEAPARCQTQTAKGQCHPGRARDKSFTWVVWCGRAQGQKIIGKLSVSGKDKSPFGGGETLKGLLNVSSKS